VRYQSYIPRPSRRPDGRAVIRLNGIDHYLGQAGDWPKGRKSPPPSIQAEYQGLIATWLASGRTLPGSGPSLTVNDVILAYDTWAEPYYHREGKENVQMVMIRDALGVVMRLFGRTPAADFGPLKLEAVQQAMAAKGWSRNYVNEQVGRVRRMFRWAVSRELVPRDLYHGLAALPGLRKGAPGVRETGPVKPVPEAVVEVTLPHMPKVVRAMIRVEMLTGMRPGEVCLMRACDIDTTGRVWVYRPSAHKTEHHGKAREVYIGPQAQEVIKPWLKLELQAFLFSPAESEAARNAERRDNRKTPRTPSQANRRPKKNPKRSKRGHYDETSLRNAVYRACDKAFPPPRPLARREGESSVEWQGRLTEGQKQELARWRSEHRWHPNQLRHTAATMIRKEYGIETARIQLGHSRAFTTEIYAEADRLKAMEAMAKLG
jgi:integrase